MPSDHLHERGNPTKLWIGLNERPKFFCACCNVKGDILWWEGYEEAQNDLVNGLPDHGVRTLAVASKVQEVFTYEFSVYVSDVSAGIIAVQIIAAYLAPLPKEE